jgi:DNA-binding CsgD family transcriptional regulator
MNSGMKTFPDEKSALVERVKELNCLYGISKLFSQRSLSLEGLLKEIIKVIPAAFQFPERTCAQISYDGREYRSENYSTSGASLKETIELKKRKTGFVEVAYCDDLHVSRIEFLEDERKLLKAIAGLLGNIIEKKDAEISLKRTTDDLRKQKIELENKNIALREIVSQIGLEKKAIQDQMRLNIELTVLPLLNRIQNPDTPPEVLNSYLRVAQQNLLDITSSFTWKVIEDRVRLSPRELEICNLIKNGLSNKEIADLLQISLLTVERHRHNIRKKLNIDNKKINLATFLRDL